MRTAVQPAPHPEEVLQRYVDHALQEVLPSLTGTRIRPFGSRVYDGAGPKSDYDFYLELPKKDAEQAKVLRASIRQKLIDAGVTSCPKSHDELKNNTLKWTTLEHNLNVSINIAEEGSIRQAVLITELLRDVFRRKPLPARICDAGCSDTSRGQAHDYRGSCWRYFEVSTPLFLLRRPP